MRVRAGRERVGCQDEQGWPRGLGKGRAGEAVGSGVGEGLGDERTEAMGRLMYFQQPLPLAGHGGVDGGRIYTCPGFICAHTHVCIPRSHREHVPGILKKAKPVSNRLHCSSDSHLRRQDFQLIHLIHLLGSSPPRSAAGVQSCPEPSQPQGQPAAHWWLLQSLATTMASALSGLPGPCSPRLPTPPALPFI